MQPFTIQCTTCRRSLRVVDPEAVGQILSCPKCTSMVLVEAPAGWDLSPNAPTPPVTIVNPTPPAPEPKVASSSSIVNPIAAAAPPITATSLPVAKALEASTVINATTSKTAKRVVARKPVPVAKPLVPATCATSATQAVVVPSPVKKIQPVVTETPPVASVDASVLPADRWPRWFWPGVAGTLALGVALIALRLMLHRADVAPTAPVDNGAIAQSPPMRTTPPIETSPPVAPVEPTVTPPAHSQPVEKKFDHSVAVADSKPMPVTSPDVHPIEQTTSAPDKTAATINPAEEIHQTAPAPNSSPLIANDGPPAPTNPASVADNPPPAATPEPKADIKAELKPNETADPPHVANSGPMRFGTPSTNPTAPPAKNTAQVDPPALPMRDAPQPRTLRRVQPRTVNVNARLGDVVPAMETRAMPLVDFLNLISDLSTIQISVDADALSDLGQSFVAPVTLKLESSSVGEILDAALDGLKLGYRVQDGGLLVGYPPQSNLREAKYTVVDLTGNDAKSLESLALVVRRMLSPQSWQLAGGHGTMTGGNGALVVNQTDAVHNEIILLCEKLRVARGLPPKSRLDPSRFVLTTRSDKGKQLLAIPVTANFGTPQTLANVVKWLHANTGATFLIDHAALARLESSDESESSAVAVGKPLSAFLDDLLTPMDLAWRAIDERTIEITTRDAAAAHMEIEFYPLGELAGNAEAAQALIGQIKAKIEPQSWGDRLNQAAMQFDAPSHAILVRAPQKTQSQIQKFIADARPRT